MKILFIILAMGALFCLFLLVKNINTINKRMIIINAIQNYRFTQIINHDYTTGTTPIRLVDYNDMETYEQTLFRFWDFSIKHILPYDKYLIIEDYIENRGDSMIDKNIPVNIDFNYAARGFCCPICNTGVSLDTTTCHNCGQSLNNPYIIPKIETPIINIDLASEQPSSCKNCSNHPTNGGSGICHCVLGQPEITC